ncbi:hypothetical protein DAMA08_031150 [Martiniozyma asiatica (nom. inval.)]|nr:hypothetical protein DAMA08_031150 [Martiniozyma asiatica]
MSKQRLQTKRRLVSNGTRQRALFSCDRCKIRKTKCNRISDNDLRFDNITPCIQCTKAGVSCTTSIPRKKRYYGPVKNINAHYKCLLALVTGLFPDHDVYNIKKLIELGRSYKFEMPDISSLEDIDSDMEDIKSNSDDGKILAQEENQSVEISENDFKEVIKEEQIDRDIKRPKLPANIKLRGSAYDKERLIMDKFGHTHFIGNFGTASLLNGLCDIIIKRSFDQKKPPTSTQDIRDSSVQTITCESTPIYQYPTHLYNLDSINIDRFPLINIVQRLEADVYVDVFFKKVHPYYFIFNQNSFMKTYEIFWEELDRNLDEESEFQPMKLTSPQICSIYMVWILGRRFQQFSSPENLPHNAVLDQEIISRFVDIIRLSLSDVVLTPTIEGIRLLILFSVYLSSIKVRESGYCLMQMACIQAKSLGLHRKFIVDKFNHSKSDVMKRIMWSLTKIESTLCCSFGRSSVIPREEIDIDLPKLDDVKSDQFKTYYFQSVRLTSIIFEILDYKKRTQKDPLSVASIEKAIYFKKRLESFWDELTPEWKDYKSLPIARFKPKLHTQYHYYFITLTLPLFLHIANSQSFFINDDDLILELVVRGIKSSFKTAEIISYTDSKGFFNGTIYYDVFYCYNAIMVLTLTFIMFGGIPEKDAKIKKASINLENLQKNYGISVHDLLRSINLIRGLVMNNLDKIDGTMKRISDIIETLLEDLGIIKILVKDFEAVQRERSHKEETSVGSMVAQGGNFGKWKVQLERKRKKENSLSVGNRQPKETLSASKDSIENLSDLERHINGDSPMYSIGMTSPIIPTSNFSSGHISNLAGLSQPNFSANEENDASIDISKALLELTSELNPDRALSSMSLNTDLMDALFGSEWAD